MKKIFLSLIVLFAGCNMVDAQTYYYKIISKVNPDTGVKSSYSNSMYITFTNNKNVCYESDKSGNIKPNRMAEFGKDGATGRMGYVSHTVYGFFGPITSAPSPAAIYRKCDGVFRYSRYINNMYEYKCYYYDYYFPLDQDKSGDGYLYIYFSKDYQRINVKSQNQYDKGVIYVGERATPPGQASAPTHMY